MRIVLIHGFNASPEMNFHPWLAAELRERGFDVVCPKLTLKSGEELDLPAAIEEMRGQVGVLSGEDIILGHSLGALVALQYLEAVEMAETPRALIMVAAPWKVSRPELRKLFLADLDADVLMWKAKEFIVIHSKDDQLVPIEHGERLAETFKARLLETDGDDHFMGEKYPVLLETILEVAKNQVEFAPGQALPDAYQERK